MRVGKQTGSWFAVSLVTWLAGACGGAGPSNDTKPAVPAKAPEPPKPTEPRQLSKAGNVVYDVDTLALEPLRVSGEKQVVPDDRDKRQLLNQLKKRRVEGLFKLCLDETGHYESGLLLESTGLPGYDAKIALTMMEWVFRPYMLDGAAIPVCARFKYIYTMR